MPGARGIPDVNARGKPLAGLVIQNLALDEHFFASRFALFNYGQWIVRHFFRIDVAREIAEGDDLKTVRVQVSHELLETVRCRMHPGMVAIRNSVKLQDGDASAAGLIGPSFEISQRPIRAGVACGRKQQWMIRTRFVSKAASPFVRM